MPDITMPLASAALNCGSCGTEMTPPVGRIRAGDAVHCPNCNGPITQEDEDQIQALVAAFGPPDE